MSKANRFHSMWVQPQQLLLTIMARELTEPMVDLTMALFARFRVNGCISELFTLAMIT
jgi:hypothetical protein